MKKGLLSVIIPSRNEVYLQGTINDLLDKAGGDIEIIVVMDGERPGAELEKNDAVTVLRSGSIGMRPCINLGVSRSDGEWIMKVDEHCRFDEGFDIKLEADCEDNWIATPARYQVDKNWEPFNVHPVVNMKMDKFLGGYTWVSWRRPRKKIRIDDCLLFQGSCYFMTRKHWDWLGGLDSKMYGPFHYESQEICFKTWLGGGRVVTNKKTWYKHLYRRNNARVYGYTNIEYKKKLGDKLACRQRVVDYWVTNRWEGRVHDFEWLLNKFGFTYVLYPEYNLLIKNTQDEK